MKEKLNYVNVFFLIFFFCVFNRSALRWIYTSIIAGACVWKMVQYNIQLHTCGSNLTILIVSSLPPLQFNCFLNL